MNKRFLTAWLLGSFFVPHTVWALSIEQAWQQAKQQSPDARIAELSVQLSVQDQHLAKSELLPSLSGTAGVNWSENNNGSNNYGATLEQTLWDSRKWSALDKADASWVLAQLERNQAYNQLAHQLLTAYFELAEAQGNLTLAQQKQADGKQLLAIAEQRYLAGKIKSVELEELRVNQLDEESTILNTQAQLETKRSLLAILINASAPQVSEVNTHTQTPTWAFDQELDHWLTAAKDHSPELLIAIQRVAINQIAKQQSQSGYYPTLRASAGYQDGDQQKGEFNAGLTLSIPIDLNGATRSDTEKSHLNWLMAQQQQRKVEIELDQNLRQQVQQVEIEWQQIAMADQQVAHREQVLRSKQKLFDAGLAEASDLIDAHNSLFRAKHNLASRWYAYWRQRIALLKLTGLLNDDAIAQLSGAFR
ncbi:TolC family protein [Vibrio metoecus]|uniref:TolC family protein n=1 Tax=Vibrio metoecus TaxID=1481663 RepID=UPI00272D883E|nr:TolC family protein [Vibrio metoecus]WKY94288.1 TolC family protein [Vibrio metoecus]